MSTKLIIFIIVCIVVFIYYVLSQVRKDKISMKNALIWLIMSVGVVICVFQADNLLKLIKYIGIETVSNMIFFLGFMFLIFMCFYLTKTLFKQNKKIISLIQRLSIVENEMKKKK